MKKIDNLHFFRSRDRCPRAVKRENSNLAKRRRWLRKHPGRVRAAHGRPRGR